MITDETIRELERVQGLLCALVEELDEDSYRRQFHPDLSALGWHLGHCTYVECYWLHEEYSTPWFDGRHRSLRGGSLHTQPRVKRPSFRNFYESGKRHIFVGLRLVY